MFDIYKLQNREAELEVIQEESRKNLELMNDLYEKVFNERPFKIGMEIPLYWMHQCKYDLYKMSR